LCFIITASQPSRTINNDKEVFKSYYDKFCGTMTDVEDLLKYFVTENIISTDDQSEIFQTKRPSQKVALLLKHISGPLESGNNKPFRIMLRIMVQHGNLSTAELSTLVQKCVTPTTEGTYVCMYVWMDQWFGL